MDKGQEYTPQKRTVNHLFLFARIVFPEIGSVG